MEFIAIIIILILLFIVIYPFYKLHKKYNERKEEISSQIIQISEQQSILDEISKTKATLKTEISKQKDLIYHLRQEYDDISKDYQDILIDFNVKKTQLENDLQNESKEEIENLQKIYYNIQKELYDKKSLIEKDINSLNKDIDKLKEEQQTIINRRIQEEQENNKIEDYKLQLNEQQLNDLKVLREVEYKISDKDSINKLIWKCSYEKPFNNLITRILKPSANKLIGIYKITNLDNGKSYIGQSVDLKERLRAHIKAGIGIDFKNNLLYNEMRKTDLTNFTFEIIEYCSREELNDREKFWIDYYLTNQYGLNMTRGNDTKRNV